MLNKAYTHASVVLVIFHYYMVQTKQSNSHSLYSMTSVVVLFAYPTKLTILTRNGVKKLYERSYIVILSDLSNTTIKMLDKISFHKHFNCSQTGTKSNDTRPGMQILSNVNFD